MLNKIKLRTVAAAAICLAGLILFFSCDNDDNDPIDHAIVGQWVTTNNNVVHNDTIHFTANRRVEKYFRFMHTALHDASLYYFTYDLSANKIKITKHQPEIAAYSEAYDYHINDDSLTIKGFSNPFSLTNEARGDVHFIKIE